VFLVLFLAPVFVPLDLVAGWVHTVAEVNPFTPIVETGRDLIAGTEPQFLAAAGIGVALVALFMVWAVRGLRRAEAAG
jgi:ABC-2 type transport system permease protein